MLDRNALLERIKTALSESDDVGRCPDCDRWLSLRCAVDGDQSWGSLEQVIAESLADAISNASA